MPGSAVAWKIAGCATLLQRPRVAQVPAVDHTTEFETSARDGNALDHSVHSNRSVREDGATEPVEMSAVRAAETFVRRNATLVEPDGWECYGAHAVGF